ncbi:tetraspanin-33 isoform X2 [Polyodon spathula]|uniref:tetraspanin-33 isoform X2 n=1 Tax=Polyodon spathula TaxID=7913 RepID=UPI001B7E4447|nr:tetraspanin-33 isoform X2 [Polyodon spathula]
MARRPAVREYGEDFSFVSPVVKYLLFIFNMLFWVISMVMISIGVYARVMKHAEAAMACLAVDPAVMLMVIGVLMFLITFCGCIGSVRENICLLQTLAAGVLGFVFSDKARGKVSEIINNAIIHYRDDLDLQNLIDYGQQEFSCCGGISYKDWSQNMYFNCTPDNPSRERCSVPYSCCLHPKDEAVINTMCGQGMQDLDYLKAGVFINTNGCIDKLVNWIHGNLFLLGGIALGLAIPQLVGILLSQVLINQIKDQIELQRYNLQHRSDPWS